MENFILNLFICSAVMSAISVFQILASVILKRRWSAAVRYYSWLVILTGFLTPVKPHIVSFVHRSASFAQPFVQQEQSNSFLLPVFFLWLLGIVISSVVLILKASAFRSSLERLSYLPDAETVLAADSVSDELGIRKATVLILPGIQSPMMFGFFNPTVILPDRKYDKDSLRLILKHELMHFKRRDIFIKLFELIVRTVHWFNPLVYLFMRHIDAECELACDEKVLSGEGMDVRKLYCKTILNSVRNPDAKENGLFLKTSFGSPKEKLKDRLSSVVFFGRRKRLAFIIIAVIALTVASGNLYVNSVKDGDFVEESTLTTTGFEAVVIHDSGVDETSVFATTVTAIFGESIQDDASYDHGEETSTAPYTYDFGEETTTVQYPYNN